MAEGVGFEPTRGISPPKRLAGARTRPLCDPSNGISCQYSRDSIADATQLLYEYSTRGRNSWNSFPISASFPSPSRHSRLSSYPLSASFPSPSRHSRLSSYPPSSFPPPSRHSHLASYPPHRHSHHHHVIPASHPTPPPPFPPPSRHSRLSSYLPPSFPPPSRHSREGGNPAARVRRRTDDALVEPHVVARLRARATILTCARWRDTTTLSWTCDRFSFSKRDLPVFAAPD